MLIVDDNATNRKVLTLQTAKRGMTSRDTESPAEALRWLEAGDTFHVAIRRTQRGTLGSAAFVAVTWLLTLRLPALPGREADKVTQLRTKAALASD